MMPPFPMHPAPLAQLPVPSPVPLPVDEREALLIEMSRELYGLDEKDAAYRNRSRKLHSPNWREVKVIVPPHDDPMLLDDAMANPRGIRGGGIRFVRIRDLQPDDRERAIVLLDAQLDLAHGWEMMRTEAVGASLLGWGLPLLALGVAAGVMFWPG